MKRSRSRLYYYYYYYYDVGRRRDDGSNLSSPSTNKSTTPLNRKITNLVDIKPNKPTTLPTFSPVQLVNSSFKTSTPSSAKACLHLFLQRLIDDIPNFFSDYFTEKIRTIRNSFPLPNPTDCQVTYLPSRHVMTGGQTTKLPTYHLGT